MISMQLLRQGRAPCGRRGDRETGGKSRRLINRRGGFGVVTGMAFALLSPAPGVAQNDERALTDAYNASGSAVFKQVSGAPGDVVLSPLSVGTAMAMTLSGAHI
jgi:serpin B